MSKVFLGGTCNGSDWREKAEKIFDSAGIGYYNPVVEDWTPECQEEELKQREECDFCLYVITPKMTGVYSIAEVVDDSNKRPEKTIFVVIDADGDECFTKGQRRSLEAVALLVEGNSGQFLNTLGDVSKYILKTQTKG